MRYAKNRSTLVILDIDYRPVLWGLTAAGAGEERFVESRVVTERLQGLLKDCDLIVGTEEEIKIAGGTSDTLQSLRAIRKKSSAAIVLKRGPLGCTIFAGKIPDSIDAGISVRGATVDVLNVLGAGDAFLSGFLHTWLQGKSWQECATAGNACGALVVSRHACTPAMPTAIELEDYMQRSDQVERPDKDQKIRYLHAVSTRAKVACPLMILAFDHRRQLEELDISLDAAGTRISEFKALVAKAVEQVAAERGDANNLGIILDDRYGSDILDRFTQQQWWIGRPVEIPGSRPVNFDPQNNFGLPLTRWPASHVVKCLVFYHPDDDMSLRLEQERRVRELSDDCQALGRELLLEVISSNSGQACNHETTANVMRRFYNLGVLPAWWKLESQTIAGWQGVAAVIERYDPLCRGVLLLGLDAPESELKQSFEVASQFPVCKGFAVGRSIFGESARQWFNGDCDDKTVIRDVARNYLAIIRLWMDASVTVAAANAGANETPGTARDQL